MFLRQDRAERKEEHKNVLDALNSLINGSVKLDSASEFQERPQVSPRPVHVQHRPKEHVDLAVS